jgi:hypothetical protein
MDVLAWLTAAVAVRTVMNSRLKLVNRSIVSFAVLASSVDDTLLEQHTCKCNVPSRSVDAVPWLICKVRTNKHISLPYDV